MIDSFKNSVRATPIKSSLLSLDDLRKLFEIVKTQNEESKKLQLDYIDENQLKSENPLKDDVLAEIKNIVNKKSIVGIEVISGKGHYFRTFDVNEVFYEDKIPDNVNKIIISNTILFNLDKINAQPYKIIIDLDFAKTTLLDLSSNPTNETLNLSKIEIWGISENWVTGVHEKVLSFLKQRENRRYWLHRKGIYDLFLVLLIIPIIFWNLYKLDNYIHSISVSLSPVIIVFIYLYVFLCSLLIFNLAFKYLRYLFPPMELKSNIDSKGKIIRRIIVLIFSSILLKFIVDIFTSIVTFLF